MIPYTTATIRAASQAGMTAFRARMKQAVRAPRAASPSGARAAEHPRPRPRLLALLGDLGLGQLELLVDQPGRLLGELLEQLTDRPIAQVVAITGVAGTAGMLGCHGHLRAVTAAGRGRGGSGEVVGRRGD